MDLKLPFGINEGELVSIENVESGLACNCTCPACGNKLVARKGEIKAHHFSHFNSDDCNSGLETALHIMAKDIIANSKAFTTPVLYYPNTEYVVIEEKEIPVDDVVLETKVGGLIPDIVITSKGKKLLIEIVVTNPVSWQKLERLKSMNLAVIEIRAQQLLASMFRKNAFRLKEGRFAEALVSESGYKSWLHNPKLEIILKHLEENYASEFEVRWFKTKDRINFEYVEACPLEKQTWKSGRNKGKTYASVDSHCATCEFCMKIEYGEIPHPRIEDSGYSVPRNVHCLGSFKNDFPDLIKQLKLGL